MSHIYENGKYYWYGEDKTYTRKKGKLYIYVELDHKEVLVYKLNDAYTDVTDERL